MATIYTTYFANVKKLPQEFNFVSIATTTPPGFPGEICRELMPDKKVLRAHKNKEITQEKFTEEFRKKLANLGNPSFLLDRYGEDIILVCYEGIGSFCHRHLVAEWLVSFGHVVKELGKAA
jgi:hypothetical protein